MANDDQERIRELAYTLWERAGSPEGDDLWFWVEAERQLSEDTDEDADETRENPAVLPSATILR